MHLLLTGSRTLQVKTELEDLSFKYLERKTYSEMSKKLKEKKKGTEKFIRKFY